jgi:hypothetical protein
MRATVGRLEDANCAGHSKAIYVPSKQVATAGDEPMSRMALAKPTR